MIRRIRTTILPAAAGLMLLCYAGGSGAQPILATGPDAEVTGDGLHRVDRSIMGAAWVRPDLDLTRYTRIFFMQTGVHFREVDDRPYRPRSGPQIVTEFPVDDATKVRLRALFRETFYEDLAEVESYEMSDGVGRDVLMVQGLLINVISGVPPLGPGSSVITVRYPWEASVVLELRDSMSNDILARTADQQRAEGPVDAALVWALTQPLVRSWSLLLCRRLEELSDLSGE